MKAQPHKITRRTLLKGVGVTMALPWLESLAVWGSRAASGTAAAGGGPSRRFHDAGLSGDESGVRRLKWSR